LKTSELENHALAYFLLNGAESVNIDGRFRRREEFNQTFEDAVFYTMQKFQGAVAGRHSDLCTKLVQQLIDSNCLAASHDKWSGTSYQFDATRYRAYIKNQVAADAVCQRALERGPQFWDEVFRAA
jgi:hypothetical protein